MLQITIPSREFFDEVKEEFFTIKERTLTLEHSLVSISKWESKWHKPFISKDEKTIEEQLDYVRCMTITQKVPEETYHGLTTENMKEINKYIDDSRSATFFHSNKNPYQKQVISKKKETITSELVYYWMIALEIPMECQKWHFNRLMTLIRICNIKNNKNPKKMGKKEILRNNSKLNKARRAKMGTSG
jgi:5-methylcytosine-specific restriction endonuclease McrA